MMNLTPEGINELRVFELTAENFGEGSVYDELFLQAARDAALRRGVERLRDEYRSIGWLNNTGARLVGADVVAQLDALLRAGEETT